MDFDLFCYNINIIPLTSIDDEHVQLNKTLFEIFSRIPEKERMYVLDHVSFFIMTPSNLGKYHRQIIHENIKVLDIVFLNWPEIIKFEKDQQASIITHEIAHYLLGHVAGGDKAEIEADDLIEQWGFRRAHNF